LPPILIGLILKSLVENSLGQMDDHSRDVNMKSKNSIPLLVAILILGAALAGCKPDGGNNAGKPADGPETKSLTIYFTDENRFVAAIDPYEVAVTREVSASEHDEEAVMRLLFEGPTDEEYSQGLRFYLSGCTGYSSVTVENGIARVYLAGDCNSGGATYTIANLIYVNLIQLDNIDYVKIYDQFGETEEPDGPGNSIPFSLEP
jgi:hypothetical protein